MNRRKILLLICLIFMVSLTGCSFEKVTEQKTVPEVSYNNYDSNVYVYVDPETGVNYLIYTNVYKGGITVRYNSEGKIMISDVSKEADVNE